MELKKDSLQEGVTTKGGYLVEDKLASLQKLFVEYGLARKIVPTTMVGKTDTVNVPVGDRSGVSAYVVGEGAAVTSSQGSYSQVAVQMKKIRTYVRVTQELLDDATNDMARDVAESMAWAIAKKEDTEVFTGDGTNFTGFINASSIQSVDLDGAYLTPDHISKAIASVGDKGGKISNMVIVIHPMTMHYLRTLKDSNNQYLFNTLSASNPILKTGAVGTIMGVPVYTTDVLSSAAESTTGGTVTCTDALLFDKRAGQLFVRKDITQEAEKDYDYDLWKLYTTERVGFGVIHPTLVYHFDRVKNQ